MLSAQLLLALATQLGAEPTELFLLGKPVLGGSLRAEVRGAAAAQLFLGLDTAPGAWPLGSGTLGLALSPAFQLLSLGAAGPGPSLVNGSLPSNPAQLGAKLYLQAAALTSLGEIRLSPTVQLTLAAPLPLAQVDDYCYQLQGPGGNNLSLAPIAASAFDLSVTDFSRDGTSEFTPAEVASLKGGGDPARIRLAYMSIGEAEDYRWYWNSISPSLIAAANPQWPGNFKAFYWEPEWKQVIISGNTALGKSYLNRVIDQGFDGVYLDIVDAFEFFGPAEAGGENARRNAAEEMVQFVAEMAFHARFVRGRSNFLFVPQNGSNIFMEEWYPADTLDTGDPTSPAAMAALQKERFFLTVDAIGIEDVFYGGPADQNNPLAPDTYLLGVLGQWTAANIPVLSVEYLTQSAKINAFYNTHAQAAGFIPYATVRDLDLLIINAGHPPD